VVGADHPEPLVERAIVAVTDAIEKLSFNVGLARLMELAPVATTARAKRVLVQLLAPFAPYLAEELWSRLGHTPSVHLSEWPTPNRAVLEGEPLQLGVQVDGRMRARIEIAPQANEDDVVAAAVAAVGDIRPSRVIYVPGRLVNLIH
jgi:leucyl-tRNA synthetase